MYILYIMSYRYYSRVSYKRRLNSIVQCQANCFLRDSKHIIFVIACIIQWFSYMIIRINHTCGVPIYTYLGLYIICLYPSPIAAYRPSSYNIYFPYWSTKVTYKTITHLQFVIARHLRSLSSIYIIKINFPSCF